MMRRQRNQLDAPGQDSFLDIVANLIGILIILVMVIGVSTKDALVEAVTLLALPAEPDEVDVESPEREAAAIEADINRLDNRLQRQKFEVEFRRQERTNLHMLITVANEHLEQLRDELDDTSREQFDIQSALVAAEAELRNLAEARRAVEVASRAPKVLEHLPTPMARTVFGKEVHFRLTGGRLAYVPLDELVERMKAEAPDKLWMLNDADELTETVGPRDGFLMKYTLGRKQYARDRGGPAVAMQTRIELDHFVLIPIEDDLGEPFQEALLEGSRFRSTIDGLDGRRSTVTVWVYPDGFQEFYQLKRYLFERGFLTAARPLPEGVPIGGSPHGSRSAAQ
jgi:hypothetical protein